MAVCATALSIGACNMVTGADDVRFGDLEDEDDGDTGSGNGAGPSGGPTATNASSGSGETSGAGGDTNSASASNGSSTNGSATSSSSGAGGAPTTTSSSASGETSSNTSSGSVQPTTSASSGSGDPGCGGAGPMTTDLDAEEAEFVNLLNDYRQQNGLPTVEPCISLNRAAQGHSEDMRDQNYFDHTGLNGSSPWDRCCDACYTLGCGPSTAMAENIAAGNQDAFNTFEQWRNSSGHNQNMLNGSFHFIGIGRAVGGGQYGVYWTNVFAGDDEASCY